MPDTVGITQRFWQVSEQLGGRRWAQPSKSAFGDFWDKLCGEEQDPGVRQEKQQGKGTWNYRSQSGLGWKGPFQDHFIPIPSMRPGYSKRKFEGWLRGARAAAKGRCCQGNFPVLSSLASLWGIQKYFSLTSPLDFRFALVGVEASLFITENLNIVLHVYSNPYANGNCLIKFLFSPANNFSSSCRVNQEYVFQH